LCGIAESPSGRARNIPPPPALRCAAGADLDREALDRAGDHAERGEEHRVAVARDDLGGHRLDRQAQLFRDVFLDRGIDVGEGADRARNRAGRDLGARRHKPRLAAVELGIGLASLRPNVVGSAWMPWLRPMVGVYLVLHRAALDRGEQVVEIGKQDVAGARELHREASCRARRSWSCPDA
jgi:hypothetical protein